MWGETVRKNSPMFCFRLFQSTHPVWGETGLSGFTLHGHIHFNPLTPCGVRPQSDFFVIINNNFNPLTPCGVRQRTQRYCFIYLYFNPLTPCGVRHYWTPFQFCKYHFNPLTPCGVRPSSSNLSNKCSSSISIHSPRVG